MYKILRIHNRLIVGGPSLNVTLLSTELKPEFETMLLVGKKDPLEKDAGYIAEQLGITPIQITEMRRSIQPVNDIRAYFRIKKIIKEFKPDIVHTHASKSGAIGRLAASSCGVRLIVHTFHGHVFHSYFSRTISNLIVSFERYLAKKTDVIIAISEVQRQELAEIYKIAPSRKICVIPLGFNLEKYNIDQERKRVVFRSKYGFENTEIVIGIIGRIVPIKNHEMFVEVAALVRKTSAKNVRFAIVGDGESLPVIESKCTQLGLSYSYYLSRPGSKTDVVVTSWETEIDQVLAGLDIVVLTSYNEGTPVSLIEAQAAHKPVVSTDVGGVKDVITHGENGFLTRVNDVPSFAGYVKMLVEDKALRDSMGSTGFSTVINRFSSKRLIRDVKALYFRFLEKNKASLVK
jgi:glycosyltransferase involved in cell wall biosynthesis